MNAVETPTEKSRRSAVRFLPIAIGALVIVASITVAVSRLSGSHIYAGTILDSPTIAPPLTGMTLDTGEAADLSAYAGKVVVIFFGYTSCPDICPTTMSTISSALDALGDRAGDVQVLFVSVDPQRDTGPVLEQYTRYWGANFAGVRGAIGATTELADAYGVYFERGEDLDGGGYVMNHTSAMLGIDTDGNLGIVWSNDTEADALGDDLAELLG